MHAKRLISTSFLAAVLVASPLFPQTPAQQPTADVAAPGARTTSRIEPPVENFTRRDRDTIALILPAQASQTGEPRTLLLHDFDFNGEPVDTSKLHLHLLSPGVYELSSLAYVVGYWRFRVTDSAAFYGLGEHFDTLNHAHTIVRNVSMDNGGRKGSSAYKCIPFFMSTTGYGLWLDTTGEATFDMNASNRDEVIVDAATNRLRILLFVGGSAEDPGNGAGRFPSILSAFTAYESEVPPLPGLPPVAKAQPRAILPPYWAFAPWQARDYHQNQAQVLEDIDKTRELGLPASVILIDSPWTDAYNDYEFNPKQFDDAPAMIKHLHGSGYKLVLWHTSWIDNQSNPPKEEGFEGKMEPRSPNYDEAASNGFFVRTMDGKPWVGAWWKGKGSLIDFTNPNAKIWWQTQVRLAIAAGADGFKDDDAEGAFFPGSGEVKFFDGTDPRLMRNRYGTLYNNAMEELIQKDLKGNGVLFARSVTTGANNIGFLWGGDNEASFSPDNGLPTVVTAGISAGLSGLPLWGADIGGYLGQPDTPNPLLLQRWTEFAAFTPMMEVMSSKNITPWTFDKNSPSGTPALDTYKKFAILHMSLFPYRYAAAREAVATGMPPMRALVLEYQDDPRARAIKDEYLFGPDLLVAPVIDENTSRVVYLPAGEWINLFTGEAFTGPRGIIAQAPPDTIPVYARRGAILPKIPEDVMTLVPQSESGNKTVTSLDDRRVYELIGPAAASASSITDFENRTILRSENTLAITGDSAAHIILRWRFTTPHSATVNGQPVSIANDPNGIPTIEFDHTSSSSIAWQ
jgi:alpha-D-xyloside xylohydrolase